MRFDAIRRDEESIGGAQKDEKIFGEIKRGLKEWRKWY